MKPLAALLVFCAAPWTYAADEELTRAQLEQELDAYRRILLDWGGLTHYGSENSELKPGAYPVIFFGDQITENWGQGKAPFFPGKPYLNRGVARQTTAQMLVRFRQDVIDLKPKVVIIQGGINDVGSVMGPSPESVIAEHFTTMVELAKLHGIRVILASVTPVCDCSDRDTTYRRPPGKIIGLNGFLKTLSKETDSIFLDYYSVLVQGRSLKRELTVNGVELSDAGYETIQPLAEKAIEAALAQK